MLKAEMLKADSVALEKSIEESVGIEETVDQARQLLLADPSQPQQALDELLAIEEAAAGDLAYDYWLGVVALRNRQPGLALLALNRVLIQQPLHAGARLERVGAYMQLRQDSAAREDLDVLAALNPPPQAQRAIEQYRAHLDARERQKTTPSHLVMLALDSGYDSNVGRTPDGYELCLGEAFCSDPFSEERSVYTSARGVYRYRYPLDERNRLDASWVGQYRHYDKSSLRGYNLGALQARLNWQHDLSLEEAVDLEARVNRLWIDQPLTRYSWQLGLAARWDRPVFLETRHRLSAHWQLNTHDQFKRNNYQLLGIDNQLRHPVTERLTLRANLLLELEMAEDEGPEASPRREGGDLQRLRLGLGGSYQLAERHTLGADISYARLLYQDAGFSIYNNLQPLKRQDSRWDASADYTWLPAAHWMLNLSLQHRYQASNLEFYDNRQTLVGAGLTYIWQVAGQASPSQ